MFIRTRERMADMWHRFRPPEEGFVFNERDGLFEARIVPKATRAIDLFLLLSFHLDSSVRVAVEVADAVELEFQLRFIWTGETGLAVR